MSLSPPKMVVVVASQIPKAGTVVVFAAAAAAAKPLPPVELLLEDAADGAGDIPAIKTHRIGHDFARSSSIWTDRAFFLLFGLFEFVIAGILI